MSTTPSQPDDPSAAEDAPSASTPARERAACSPPTGTAADALPPEARPAAPIVRDGVIRSGKLAGRTMSSAIWILAAPVLVQQVLQACVGMVDKMLAGRVDEGMRVAALDAIGIGSYVGWFIGIAMAGLGIGGQAIIARAMGAGDERLAHVVLGRTMTLAVAWGALVGAFLWLSAPVAADLCRLSPTASALYLDYIRVLALGMPFAGVMTCGAMCLHGAGETTRPAVIAVVVNLVNIVASWLLAGVEMRLGTGADAPVLVSPLGLDFGVAGIAGGTAIAYVVGAACTLLVLVRGVKDLRLERRHLGADRPTMLRIVRIGVPNFAEGISMWLVNLFVLRFIGTIAERGTGGGLQGAHVIAVQWESFAFLPGFAIGTAAGALAGQYLGAGNPALARRAVIACAGIAAVVMGSFGVVFMTAGEALTTIVSSEPVHLEIVPRLLFLGGAVQVFFAITMVVRQGLRGVGDVRWTFGITTFSSYAIRLPAAWLLGIHFELGIVGIWYALCGEFVIRCVLFVARFLHGGWTKVEV